MQSSRLILAAIAAFGATACAPDLTCEDPQEYQSAVEAPKVEAPDGLDELQSSREMQIPRASPQESRPEGSPCLDLPPTLRASSGNE